MKNNRLRHTLLPLLAALIWGLAFSVQSKAAALFGAFSLNALRYFIGVLFLSLVLMLFPKLGEKDRSAVLLSPEKERKRLIFGGFCCGFALAAASFLQQKGIETIPAGRAGFITALYVVLVPLTGLFLGKKVRPLIWISAVLAVTGLYFISVTEDFAIEKGDLLVLLSAFCFTAQIRFIDHFTEGVSAVRLARMQFLFAGVFCGAAALFRETLSAEALKLGLFYLLYLGIMSTGIAYTLQVLSQQGGDAPIVSILLSMEAVFAALGGFIFLEEKLSAREIFGCVLMFAAVLLTQLPDRRPAKEDS